MNHLYIVRHGIAFPHGSPDYEDDDRPLTPEGERQIMEVAAGLKRMNLPIDYMATSPILRAVQTAMIVGNALDLGWDENRGLEPDAKAKAILKWLDASDTSDRMMIVGHEPWIDDLISLMILGDTEPHICDVPKGGVAALSISPRGKDWRLAWLARPKLIANLIGD